MIYTLYLPLTGVYWTSSMIAVDGPCEELGHTGLAGAAGARKEISMAYTVVPYLIAQSTDDVVLSFDLLKGLRSELSV